MEYFIFRKQSTKCFWPTIKDYDREMRTYLLDFPNDEVKKGFVTMTAKISSKTGTVADWEVETE